MPDTSTSRGFLSRLIFQDPETQGAFKKSDLMKQLSDIGIDPNGTLMVHLSLKAIGEVEGRGDAVLDALTEYMKAGLLVLPSHTWEQVRENNPVMDVLYTPSCVGVLTEMFRKREGVRRSLHPTHALSAYGKDAEDFIRGEENIKTPCGEGGAYFKLWERDAQILMVGVNFNRNTFIHGIEEWDKAVGSISPDVTDLYVINEAGQRLHTPQNRHCAPLGSETFCKLEPYAMMDGILRMGVFGNATTRLTSAKALREMTAEFLRKDPGFLLKF